MFAIRICHLVRNIFLNVTKLKNQMHKNVKLVVLIEVNYEFYQYELIA